ncbi:MAG: MmgE/PrpD family protein [Desulfurella sp.]|uniref:MmgE/PrpD family protein n=1 Tax=Desulfurella sp. TaxID=1962857 RepID=UPI003C7FC9D0
MDKYTDLFANYVCSVNDFEQSTLHESKRRILDSFGVMYLAFGEDTPKAARNYAYNFGFKNGSSLFGLNFYTTPETAAFANGVLLRYLDFNDTYLSKEPLHPSDLIPGLLALAQYKHKSVSEFLKAIVIAYEISVNLCDAASLRAHGFDHVNYITIGEVCGLGRLLGLKKQEIEHAISIATIPNVSLRQTRAGELSMWKGAAAANSAKNALFAVFLAQQGVSGPYEPFVGEMGFFNQLLNSFSFDDKALESLFRLESPRRILDTHIKFYPVEYHAQSAVDIAKQLSPYIKSSKDIDSITIETFKAAYEIIAKDKEKWEPKTKETADHSLQYITVVGLIDGDISKYSFSKEKLSDEKIKEILKNKVILKENDELTKGYPDGIPNKITLKTKDGKTYTKDLKYPKGHAKNPMSDEEVIRKFKTCTQEILNPKEQERIVDAVFNIEKFNDIDDFLRLTWL